MDEREQLEQAIAIQESLRGRIDDAIIDATIKTLREKIASLKPAPQTQQQRKQVTVLFADVSGFTAISETMDAEDVQETMNALWQQVDKVILEFNGRIDKHIGDAVMALWGVDEAREDDPEQAIRAALAMQTAVHVFAGEHKHPLKMRIGLQTGPVLLGEVGTTAEFTAMGDTVNTASRLEHAAPVGGILISLDTYRHVRGVFEVERQEPLSVMGKSEPLQVYIVKGAKARAFRTYTRGVEGVETRMIGRDAELQLLKEVWQTAVSAPQSTLVTITGEAGVGKSRLLYEFEQWLELQPEIITLFKSRSTAQTSSTPNFLLRDMFSARFGIRESDSTAEVRQKFEAGIADVFANEAQMKAHFLGHWLGYDFSHSVHVATIGEDTEQLKNRGHLYLRQFFQTMARQRPCLLFLEDIHWADRPSLDAILESLQREASLPLLVVALARPSLFERHPPWQELEQRGNREIEVLAFKEPACHFVTLNPLLSNANHKLLAEILQKVADIPDKLFNLVIDRAEGNPFYMEELVKMLIDNGVIVPGKEAWQVNLTQLDEGIIPGTLTGVLQARLDRLTAVERVTLQRAAVVGRVFWDTAVQHLSDDSKPVKLTPLQKREFIYHQRETAFVNMHQFTFKHDLLRDVTYQTVLKKLRRLYHGRVAAWLVEAAEMNDRTAEFAAVIAEHYRLADLEGQAAHWYGRAGKDALTLYAHTAAIHYLTLALDLTAKDADIARYPLLLAREKAYDLQGDRQAQNDDLNQLSSVAAGLGVLEQARVALRQAKYAHITGDYNQAIIYAQAVIELAQGQAYKDLVAAGHVVMGRVLLHQGQYPAAQEHYLIGLQLAKDVADLRLESNCLDGLGSVARRQGEYIAAQGHYEKSLAISRETGDRRSEGRSLNNLGLMTWKQGDYAAAQNYLEQSLAINREIGDRGGGGRSLNNLGLVAWEQGDYAAAQKYHEQSLSISREIGDRKGEASSLNNLGIVASRQGDYASTIRYYEQSLALFREIGDRNGEASILNNLGHVSLSQGEYVSAQKYCEQALVIKREIGDRGGEGISLHNLGLVAWEQGDYAAAQKYHEQYLAISRKLGDRNGEGRSLIQLGNVAFSKKDYVSAQKYGEQALVIKQDIGDRNGEAESLNHLGAVMLALAQPQLSESYYQQALMIHQELKQPHFVVEDWAGLAKTSLIQGDREGARTYMQQILEYLKVNPRLDGAESSMRTFHYAHDVLVALGQSQEANDVLTLAVRVMQDYLDKNSDPAMRQLYLSQPHHRMLWAAWQETQFHD